jgi:hypothetical protein
LHRCLASLNLLYFCINIFASIVSLNGVLRHAQPDKLLESTARTKVRRYREAYVTQPSVTNAFLPCVPRLSRRVFPIKPTHNQKNLLFTWSTSSLLSSLS